MRAQTFETFKNQLKAGQTYRRSDLNRLSSNMGRYLPELLKQGVLKKLSTGLYVAPKITVLGEAPPDEQSLLNAFLKDDRFVIYNLSMFNSLGLGTTQLYNQRLVFNRKRSGEWNVGGQIYRFVQWREAPKSLTREFLVVEMLNRLNELAEDRELVIRNLAERFNEFYSLKLVYAVAHYGTNSTQKRFEKLRQKFSSQNLKAQPRPAQPQPGF